MEEPPPLGNEVVVAGVEGSEAAGVHLHKGPHITWPALALEPGNVLRVEVGVFVSHSGEVVQPVGEGGAVGSSDCVPALHIYHTTCVRTQDIRGYFVNMLMIITFKILFNMDLLINATLRMKFYIVLETENLVKS